MLNYIKKLIKKLKKKNKRTSYKFKPKWRIDPKK